MCAYVRVCKRERERGESFIFPPYREPACLMVLYFKVLVESKVVFAPFLL